MVKRPNSIKSRRLAQVRSEFEHRCRFWRFEKRLKYMLLRAKVLACGALTKHLSRLPVVVRIVRDYLRQLAWNLHLLHPLTYIGIAI